jgi:hypothetical protein
LPKQDLTEIAEAQLTLQPGDRLIIMELRAIKKVCEAILASLPPEPDFAGEVEAGRFNWLKGNRNK